MSESGIASGGVPSSVPTVSPLPGISKPSDVLFIGDSMLRKIQISHQPVKIWKFCYPGGTADDLHRHILYEKLPGEAQIGAVVVNIGTNDLSRSRDRVRTTKEILSVLKSFLLRLSKMYPQAIIYFIGILPRLDCDDVRVIKINNAVCDFMSSRPSRYHYHNFSSAFSELQWPGPVRIPIKNYYRNTDEDVVHLSHSGTQVFQDCYNRFFTRLQTMIEEHKIDLSMIMWQSEWERFNYWNLKTPYLKRSPYLDRKRLTNFTTVQYDEILSVEQSQKTTEN